MRKKIISLGIAGLLICITGCGNTIPEMDEQQEKLVVEYMAGTLLKYDVNHVSKLTQLPVEQTEVEESTQPEDEAVKEDGADTQLSEAEGSTETQEISEEPAVMSMDEFLGLQGVSIQYTGYVVTDFYPEQGEEVYFVMDASEGNKLLVLKFEMENISAEDVLVDMMQKSVRYKICVNGDEKNSLNTMLMNDLRYYQGTVAAGAREEVVLVREIPAEWENEIDSLELTMKGADDIVSLLLN